MQYMLLIYADESIYGADKGGPPLQEMIAKHMAFGRELGTARLAGAGLKGTATATTVRTTGEAKSVHDGPFAETKELIAGYAIVQAKSKQDAIELAKRFLKVVGEGESEIRQMHDASALGPESTPEVGEAEKRRRAPVAPKD